MKQKEILERFPGLSRWQLVGWEMSGYIKPRLIKRNWNRISKRYYSEEDLQLINVMYSYVREGISPKVAYQKIKKLDKLPSLPLRPPKPGTLRAYLEELRTQTNVVDELNATSTGVSLEKLVVGIARESRLGVTRIIYGLDMATKGNY